MLAVEHIQPKGLPAYENLIGRWENFLLSCVNCNSTKKNKDVVLADVLLPDRDNTFEAFTYTADGKVIASPGLPAHLLAKANDTLALTGLDKEIKATLDENEKQIALDRVSQRMEVWAVAEEAREDIQVDLDNDAVRRGVERTAHASGFFSIWMTVFSADTDMRRRLIQVFSGTSASECFDPTTTLAISPAPNPDHLPDGSKI